MISSEYCVVLGGEKLTDTGEDSKLGHMRKRSKVNTVPPVIHRAIFFSFFRRI